VAHHEPSVRLSRITLAAGGSRSQTNRLGGREGRGLRFRGRSGGRGAAVRYCRRQMAASLKLVEWRFYLTCCYEKALLSHKAHLSSLRTTRATAAPSARSGCVA